MNPLLELINVSYRAGDQTILDQIQWSVQSGQHWAILGPNGSGKTTLLRIACGYLWPNAGGEVHRNGKTLLDLRQLRRSIGWISSTLNAQIPPREPVLSTMLSGRFALIGWRANTGVMPTNADRQAARDYLEQMGCLALASKPFGVLSQGEQQAVLIARARMAQPMLIVLDEPCAGMDPGVRERFLSTLAEVLAATDSPALIMVTHHIEEIVPGLGHTLVLDEGRIVASGETHQVLSAETIARIYDMTPPRLIAEHGRLWPIW